jgi:tRNA threonylcarbamoyladenosine biosynthesis protein TsaB
MKILSLDCSTHACSVAILDDSGGETKITELFELAARQHTQRLLPLIDQVLVETGFSLSQLDAIAFARGPGSFTGLRICLGVVQGLAFGADLPVLPVSTLAAQAQTAIHQQLSIADINPESISQDDFILSTLDARMSEIYWGVYRLIGGLVQLVGEERLTAPERLLEGHKLELAKILAIGSGLHYVDQIPVADSFKLRAPELLPTASSLALLARRDFQQGISCRADQALPTYLRDEVTWQKQPVLNA